MNARTYNNRSAIEALEGRSMMSAVAFADFNNDGRLDKAEVTNSTTITVSLATVDGSYAVSATLKAPKNLPIGGVNVGDYNQDGKLDVSAGGLANNRFYNHTWLGNGDGTFGKGVTEKGNPIPPWGWF
jgi:hypothetical protein